MTAAASQSMLGRLIVAAAALVVAGALALSVAVGAVTGGWASVAPGQAPPSSFAQADIPPGMFALYHDAAARYGIDWAVLAAIGSIESDHGRSTAAGVREGLNDAGCCAGPMQFDATDADGNTWAAYGVDGNGDGVKDVYDPSDAVPAAASYLRAHGAPADYVRAVFAYNHAAWYVEDVLARAAAYRAAVHEPFGGADVPPLLTNPRLQLTELQRADIASGGIDERVLAILALAASEHTIRVSALLSDHPYLTSAGAVSNHAFGRAVDISAVDGEPCTGTRNGSCGRLASQLAQIVGVLHPTELIYCFDPDGPLSDDGFARPDHCNHIHVGYDS